ncbi:hypothetical protein DY000_02053907 [Brassica cretica]|uniref:Uncharacterized protein n=1 Tax=Brassica cretica TaxID=69181 RepID=A0ABQ7AJJ3_BRACR|nr:hypothetical protein DY000_02053907 [Brassica cretica]
MPDNPYTTYKLDRKGLTGKQVLRISTPERTTKGLIPLTRRAGGLTVGVKIGHDGINVGKFSRKMPLFKKKEKIVKNSGKPKLSVVPTPKRIHTISLRERLLQIPNSETTIIQLAEGASWTEHTVQLAEGASWTERTDQLAEQASWIEQAVQPAERACWTTRPFGESGQLACLRPVLVAPSFWIGSNLLLFRLDRRNQNPGPQGKFGFLDFPPITEIDGANFGSHNPKLDLDLPLSFDIWSGVALDGKWTSWNKRVDRLVMNDHYIPNQRKLILGCLVNRSGPFLMFIIVSQSKREFKYMTSRHNRRNAQGELITLSNQELARLERTNRQQPRPTNATMGDYGNPDNLAATMQQMQLQMHLIQLTIQAHEQAAQ